MAHRGHHIASQEAENIVENLTGAYPLADQVGRAIATAPSGRERLPCRPKRLAVPIHSDGTVSYVRMSEIPEPVRSSFERSDVRGNRRRGDPVRCTTVSCSAAQADVQRPKLQSQLSGTLLT
jgi:hypothetical protein